VNSKIVRAGCVMGASALCVLLWLAPPAGAQEQKEVSKQQQAGGQAQKEPAKTEPGGGGKAPAKEAEPRETSAAPRSGPPVRFEATVFEVVVPSESGINLDAKKLAADGPTPAKLAAALQELGELRVLYRIDQVVRVDGRPAKLEISRDVPYVMGTAPSPAAPTGVSVARTKVGARFELNAFCQDEGDPRFQTTIDVKLSTMNESAAKLGGDTTAPEFSDITQKYGGGTELGRPIVLLTVDGTTTSGSEESRAYVTLITLSAAAK
jgi:hypothetical protein